MIPYIIAPCNRPYRDVPATATIPANPARKVLATTAFASLVEPPVELAAGLEPLELLEPELVVSLAHVTFEPIVKSLTRTMSAH